MSFDPAGVQTRAELDEFYAVEDPWAYDSTPDDHARVARLLSALPPRPPGRTLDIGCGNGFVTARLPGREVVGVDLSAAAIEHARRRVPSTETRKVRFEQESIFTLRPEDLGGVFDLVVITGVLYPEYVGGGFSVVDEVVRRLLAPQAIVATVHIDERSSHRLPFTTLSVGVEPYRDSFARLEIFQGP
jgi:SAM-dependent methyltransferase